MLIASSGPEHTAVTIEMIRALPIESGREGEWKLVLDTLKVQLPEEQGQIAQLAQTIDGVSRITTQQFPEGVAGDIARTIAYTNAKIALGIVRENAEKVLTDLKNRVMDRSYSEKNKRTLFMRALYEKLLEKINAAQERVK
jgi:hypothetical protein